MSLSERLRPDVEAAPWVIEEVRAMEAENKRLRGVLIDAAEALERANIKLERANTKLDLIMFKE